MKTVITTLATLVALFAAAWSAGASGAQRADDIARAVIAREKASITAWQRKDKAFFADLLADDMTYFSAQHPYLEVDPKENFLPKFEQYTEMFKINDHQMYNPRVQVYGDTAVLTYNGGVSGSFNGQPLNYTAKTTVVYVRQGDRWRVVHAHESINPAPR